MTRARGVDAGFTLIEVLGAVMIVGIWFLVLSSSALQGIAAEGRAQRLMEASLVADEALADAEAQALLGLPIELDEAAYGDLDFDGRPEYEVLVATEPYDPIAELTPANPALEGAPFVDPQATQAAGDAPLEMLRLTIDVFLAGELADVDVDTARSLASRTTFLIDSSAFGLLAPAAAPPGAAPEEAP